jgi:hypothetical protein
MVPDYNPFNQSHCLLTWFLIIIHLINHTLFTHMVPDYILFKAITLFTHMVPYYNPFTITLFPYMVPDYNLFKAITLFTYMVPDYNLFKAITLFTYMVPDYNIFHPSQSVYLTWFLI